MGFTVEMLLWIGGFALAATLASLIWMVRETMREASAFVRDGRTRAAQARQAFKRAAARQAAGTETAGR